MNQKGVAGEASPENFAMGISVETWPLEKAFSSSLLRLELPYNNREEEEEAKAANINCEKKKRNGESETKRLRTEKKT